MTTPALSDAQLWNVVTSAGWTGNDAYKAFAIARAESSGRPDNTHTNANGSIDYGLFQINSIHKDLLASGDWSVAADNARMAKTLYDSAGGKFTDWVTYTTGAYAGFLASAQKASQSAPGPTADTSTSTVAGGTVDITSPAVWVRVSEFVAGGLLILLFTASVVKNTPIAHVASKAAKVALL